MKVPKEELNELRRRIKATRWRKIEAKLSALGTAGDLSNRAALIVQIVAVIGGDTANDAGEVSV